MTDTENTDTLTELENKMKKNLQTYNHHYNELIKDGYTPTQIHKMLQEHIRKTRTFLSFECQKCFKIIRSSQNELEKYPGINCPRCSSQCWTAIDTTEESE